MRVDTPESCRMGDIQSNSIFTPASPLIWLKVTVEVTSSPVEQRHHTRTSKTCWYKQTPGTQTSFKQSTVMTSSTCFKIAFLSTILVLICSPEVSCRALSSKLLFCTVTYLSSFNYECVEFSENVKTLWSCMTSKWAQRLFRGGEDLGNYKKRLARCIDGQQEDRY